MEDEFLTEVETDLLASFVENEALVETVRKVIERGIYGVGVQKKGKKHNANINWALSLTPAWSNASVSVMKTYTAESVGKELMVKAEALAELQRAFNSMLEFKKVKDTPDQTNPAR